MLLNFYVCSAEISSAPPIVCVSLKCMMGVWQMKHKRPSSRWTNHSPILYLSLLPIEHGLEQGGLLVFSKSVCNHVDSCMGELIFSLNVESGKLVA